MTTCTVVAPSTLKALRLLREQLGPDAFVVSSRVAAGGVEIVASLQAPATGRVSPVAPLALAAPSPLTLAPAPAAPVDGSDSSVLREIHSMRGMIEEQLAGLAWNEAQKRDPLRGQLLRTLLGAGFSARLAKDLLVDLPAGLNHAGGLAYIKSAMASQMPVLEDEDALMNEGGVYALMGPTGVGKTTTTAKLAARCVMRFGAEKLALITTDSYRIGAYEQLRIYGQILGVAVHAVKDASDLEGVLSSLRDKHMVLIDTVGMSQRDRAVSDQIAMLCGASRPVKRLLLLNASSHGDTLNEVVKAYRHGGQAANGTDLAGCILTKVDEATHPGGLLDIVIRHQLTIHYVSSGQKVPENLQLGNRKQLIDSVFEARSQSSFFVPGEADLDEQPAGLRNDEKVAAAEAVSQRLRAQCRQLISTLAHNAQELTATAAALAAGDIGFAQSRALWRQLSGDPVQAGAVAAMLMRQAHADSKHHCSDYVLASSRDIARPTDDKADAHIHVTALLSDRSGQPFAAPLSALSALLAGTARAAIAGKVPPYALDPHHFDNKPVVHLFSGMATFAQVQAWQAAGLRWVASVPASLQVALADEGLSATLQELASGLKFSLPQPVSFRGKAGLLSIAEMLVSLCPDAQGDRGGAPADASLQRCVVRRIVDAASGKLVAHNYLLSSVSIQAKAQQIMQWAVWRAAAEPYFKLLEQSVLQFAGSPASGETVRLDAMRVAAQACTTVFRLQQAPHAWAATARMAVAKLAGQPVQADQPVPGPVLFEGLG
ncbi:MAG: flagellar biosynthesis protein FlhF, partial [Polaromonas sp.]|nr:flagellar biosynthesis protein FlhF [Polaromonas sp.]